jgi:crAss001_48 related protein
MEPYQEQVIEEQKALKEKRNKLAYFLSGNDTHGVNPSELALLNVQFQVMLAYDKILTERIKLFK